MEKLQKIYYLIIWGALFVPSLVFAWKPGEAIVAKCKGADCHFSNVFDLINNLMSVFIWLTVPIATVLFAWIGWDLIVQGDKSGARSTAKKRFVSLLWGMLFVLAPVLIVKAIVSGLGADEALDLLE